LKKYLGLSKEKDFECPHLDISFYNYDADVFPSDLNFLNFPTADNTEKRLAQKLFKKEQKHVRIWEIIPIIFLL